ncbi:hypothetical protein Tco_0915028 [Tanacetum coccineum]
MSGEWRRNHVNRGCVKLKTRGNRERNDKRNREESEYHLTGRERENEKRRIEWETAKEETRRRGTGWERGSKEEGKEKEKYLNRGCERKVKNDSETRLGINREEEQELMGSGKVRKTLNEDENDEENGRRSERVRLIELRIGLFRGREGYSEGNGDMRTRYFDKKENEKRRIEWETAKEETRRRGTGWERGSKEEGKEKEKYLNRGCERKVKNDSETRLGINREEEQELMGSGKVRKTLNEMIREGTGGARIRREDMSELDDALCGSRRGKKTGTVEEGERRRMEKEERGN